MSDDRTISLKTYSKWCKNGVIGLGVVALIILIIAQAATQYQTILISHWSQDQYKWTEREHPNTDVMFFMKNCENSVPEIYCTTDGAGVSFVQKLFDVPSDTPYTLRSQIVASCAE